MQRGQVGALGGEDGLGGDAEVGATESRCAGSSGSRSRRSGRRGRRPRARSTERRAGRCVATASKRRSPRKRSASTNGPSLGTAPRLRAQPAELRPPRCTHVLAGVVRREGLETQLVDQLVHAVLGGADPLAAELDRRAVGGVRHPRCVPRPGRGPRAPRRPRRRRPGVGPRPGLPDPAPTTTTRLTLRRSQCSAPARQQARVAAPAPATARRHAPRSYIASGRGREHVVEPAAFQVVGARRTPRRTVGGSANHSASSRSRSCRNRGSSAPGRASARCRRS